MPSVRWSPERLFILFGGIWGLLLIVLIPPLGAGNETYNFTRAATVATGAYAIAPTPLPAGVVALVDQAWRDFPPGSRAPFGYSSTHWTASAAVSLRRDRPVATQPNPIAVLHPFAYAAQAPALTLGMAWDLRPLTLLYLGRLAGLLAGLALTWAAIRMIPFGKAALAATALLPTIVFGRATLDADQVTNGLAFLFIALVLRFATDARPMSRSRTAALALVALALAPAKSAYLLLPLFALAIPAACFVGNRWRWTAMAVIIVPGALLSVAWMLSLADGPLAGTSYVTWAGTAVPEMQQRLILGDPLRFVEVLGRTLFTTAVVPTALIELIGVFGPPIALPAFAFPILLVIWLMSLWERDVDLPSAAKGIAAALFLLSTTIVLTLLYLQWNPPGAPIIQGFQGRYLFPVLPLLLCFLPRRPKPHSHHGPELAVLAMGLIAGPLTLWTTWHAYWT